MVKFHNWFKVVGFKSVELAEGGSVINKAPLSSYYSPSDVYQFTKCDTNSLKEGTYCASKNIYSDIFIIVKYVGKQIRFSSKFKKKTLLLFNKK